VVRCKVLFLNIVIEDIFPDAVFVIRAKRRFPSGMTNKREYLHFREIAKGPASLTGFLVYLLHFQFKGLDGTLLQGRKIYF
jgi:hypothetical protein